MIEEALSGPVSVSMLKIDGKRLMEVCHIPAGPKIGWLLHALFEEVIEDVKLNTTEYLEKRALWLVSMDEKALKDLGEAGKERKEEEVEKKKQDIRKKHFVS